LPSFYLELKGRIDIMTVNANIELDNLLKELKVDKVGIINLDDCKDARLWNDTQKLLPEAKAIVVLAMEVFPETVNQVTSKAIVGDLALRDLYLANSDVIDGILDWEGYKMVKRLHAKDFKGLLLPAKGSPYDARFLEGPLSYKHLAEAAGLGTIGWNSLLITAEYGARVRLACIITDAPFASSAPLKMESPCPKCGGACIKICPIKAIARPEAGESYNLDKYACCSYYTASGMCAQCLRVCPAGRASQ
jgi:epoxyqueuosine reductase